MNKKLYFNYNPKIKCFLHHAYVFGMIQDNNLAEHLAINNFVQVYINDVNWFDFCTPDFFHDTDIFERKYLTLPITENVQIDKSLINIIIDMINKGYYVAGTFNEFYIPFCWHHNRWDFDHKFLLNGFDDQKKIFNLIGYYGNNLVEKEIPFKEFLLACKNVSNEVCELIFMRPNIVSDKIIDVEKIKSNFKDFLCSKTSDDYGYNINCSGITAMNNKLESITQKQKVYIPILYLFYEHSKALMDCLKYLYINGYYFDKYIEECQRIINMCNININLKLKGNMSGKNYNGIIVDNLKNIINDEKILIEKVLTRL